MLIIIFYRSELVMASIKLYELRIEGWHLAS